MKELSFVAKCLIGKEEHENIHDYIEQWHTSPEDGVTLGDFLGFTKEEYSWWLSGKYTIGQILHCR